MKIFEDRILNDNKLFGTLPEDAYFLDIETTGLSPAISHIYLIGVAYACGEEVVMKQWFMEKLTDEAQALKAYSEFAKGFDTCIHYNGTTFDLPFLRKCAKSYYMDLYEADNSLDLKTALGRYAYVLKPDSFRQRDLETVTGYIREDGCTGAQLVEVYEKYEKEPTGEAPRLLLLHNHDDLLGMLRIHSLLQLSRVEEAPLCDVCINLSNGLHATARMTGIMLPQLRASADGFLLELKGDRRSGDAALYEGRARYYFDDYRDYYYLPDEDMAIHKSVGVYVDSSRRQRANAYNCYQYIDPALITGAQAQSFIRMAWKRMLIKRSKNKSSI